MVDVTYYVALPFTVADDGVAQAKPQNVEAHQLPFGEPKRYRASLKTLARSLSVALAIRQSVNFPMRWC
jgi:hypothetical protein